MILASDAARGIASSARESYPYECCGALLGSGDSIELALPLPNQSEEPKERRFVIRPDDYRRAELRAAQEGCDLLGFYHSHPNHPAAPSAFDLAHAWPNLTYVILSIHADHDGDLRAWQLTEDRSRFEPVELSISEP